MMRKANENTMRGFTNRKLARRLGICLCVLVLSWTQGGCSANRVAKDELTDVDRQDQVELQEVIHQVRLALMVIHAYYSGKDAPPDAGLILEKAELTVNATHEDTDEGDVTLFLPTGDAKEAVTASAALKLTLTAPSGEDLDVLFSATETAEQQTLLSRLRAMASNRCTATASKPASPQRGAAHNATAAASAAQPQPKKALWESIARVTVAGLNGYLCSVQKTGQAHMPASEFEITLTITTETTDSEGLTISLGAWSLGDTATQDADQVNTVVLTFKQNAM